jgi:hypothetical protein
MIVLQKELARQHEGLESYLDSISSIGIVLLDSALNILDCNQGFIRMFHLEHNPLGSPVADFLNVSDGDLKKTGEIKLSCNHLMGIDGALYCHAAKAERGHLLFCERLILTDSRAIDEIGAVNNELINLQRELVKKNLLLEKLRRELDARIAELEATLARVRQLEGIITICAYCKKIRDDQDSWGRLEHYISQHSEAKFSHGICPACLANCLEELGT